MSDLQLAGAFRKHLRAAIACGFDSRVVFLVWMMSHTEVTHNDLIGIYNEEVGEKP